MKKLLYICIISSMIVLQFSWSSALTAGTGAKSDVKASQAATGTAGQAQPAGNSAVHANNGDINNHSDPIAPIVAALAAMLVGAAIGRHLTEKMGQPGVLGELLAGVIIGNACYFFGSDFITILRDGPVADEILGKVLYQGMTWAQAAREALPASAFSSAASEGERIVRILSSPEALPIVNTAHAINVFSQLGVILLLFLVGLESSVHEMTRVGLSAFMVAIVGVVTPFFLGQLSSWWLMPNASTNVHMFVGATLCATSVGITARVLKDLGSLQTEEARIILGAAVVDDVLGLIILAVVGGIIANGSFSVATAVTISAKSAVFVVAIVALGSRVAPAVIRWLVALRVKGGKLILPLVFLFLLSWLANFIGLAPIVGAFLAGLVLEEGYFEVFGGKERTLHDLIEPLEALIVPVFFVLMGTQVKLELFLNPTVLGIALVLTVAAIVGKQVCGFVVSSRLNRLTISAGMIPRGEVGLIFASVGRGLGVVDDVLFSAVVIMVMVTTFITPPYLKLALLRRARVEQPA